jgi:hypothetical protein
MCQKFNKSEGWARLGAYRDGSHRPRPTGVGDEVAKQVPKICEIRHCLRLGR